jgi:hypothetical protein
MTPPPFPVVPGGTRPALAAARRVPWLVYPVPLLIADIVHVRRILDGAGARRGPRAGAVRGL